MSRLPRPAFCLVTPGRLRSAAGGDARDLVRLIARAARAGVNLIQIRERELADGDLASLVAQILAEVERSKTLVVVNERADVALAAGADGVHLRAASVAAPRLRPIVPERFLIGRSVHSTEEAIAADVAGGTDYLIFGTVFASASKPAQHPVAGLDQLRRVCGSVQVPVIAIGGMTRDRLKDVAAAGASGFAAIGMFIEADRDAADRGSGLMELAVSAFVNQSHE
jgi:thiamine-phosphate pyrophosphorylase